MGASEVSRHLYQSRNTIRQKILNLRAFSRYASTDEFEEVFFSVKADIRNQVDAIFDSADLDKLRAWVKANRKQSLETLSYRELRERAKNQNIFFWSRLSKDELVEALRAASVQPSARSSE